MMRMSTLEKMAIITQEEQEILDGREICLKAGDMIFLNQHVSHAIKKASKDVLGINFMTLPQFFDLPLSMLQKNNPLADFIVNIRR